MFDPKTIGRKKPPEVSESSQVLRDTDQRWFSEVSDLYPTGNKLWDGDDYAPELITRKLARLAAIDRVARRFLQGD